VNPPGSFLHWFASVAFALAAVLLFIDAVDVSDGLALVSVGLALLAAPWRP
jgi:hypothetical protein